MSACLDNIDEHGDILEQEMTIKSTAATMYSGGADTTVSTIGSFILCMIANPKVQEKAHAEIDSVCKQRELPTFDDMDSLPYVAAIVKEVLRYKNVAPLSELSSYASPFTPLAYAIQVSPTLPTKRMFTATTTFLKAVSSFPTSLLCSTTNNSTPMLTPSTLIVIL